MSDTATQQAEQLAELFLKTSSKLVTAESCTGGGLAEILTRIPGSSAWFRIAGSDLIYRHSSLRTEYYDENPRGMDVPLEFEPELDDEKWVLDEWEKDERVSSEDG